MRRYLVLVFVLGAACGDDGGVATGAHDAPVAEVDAAATDAAPGAPDAGPDAPPPRDVTFFVVADTHADPPPSYDLRAIARVINTVADDGAWPDVIDGEATGFVGGPIGAPSGVVFLGDLTGWGTAPLEIPTFQRYFQAGASARRSASPRTSGWATTTSTTSTGRPRSRRRTAPRTGPTSTRATRAPARRCR